ncbi:hypothetical protein [Paraglaciecola arctica]|uniref:Type 4 fimbrial biogenesis protein PilX N-terminal domain-containing protein n=1 Tax=Paraglaciecola arctica BSs20135 TaxID=493475 RepID=K6YPA3_9ALTE|nr:hypothetical protein [Paraglaciecola arctica]GAC18463.1 hypothetical protein GARC_1490 [Paraglaciecola arctica BSs20135]
MNKLLPVGSSRNLKQQGAAILLTVVLLLIMVTLVTLYTGKIQSFEHQIMLNTQNQKWAQASAQAGLNQGLAILNVNKEWPGVEVVGNLDDSSTFNISAISEDLLGNRKLVTMNASGRSADGLAKATVIEQSLVYPILVNPPTAPLIVQHGFSSAGEFEVVTNPDGLGAAAPLSLWSDAVITLSGTSHHSCILSVFNQGDCSTDSYSDHSIKQSDIADSSASFPADLVSYLFNIPSAEWIQLQHQSDFVLADCDTLDIGSWGVIWVNGDCDVSASTQIATASEPIILVIFDGKVEFHSDVVMYGLLFSFKPVGSIKDLDINMQTDSAVFGAVVANYQLGTTGDLTRVVFQANVLQQLQNSKKLQRVARVPGSWHDF